MAAFTPPAPGVNPKRRCGRYPGGAPRVVGGKSRYKGLRVAGPLILANPRMVLPSGRKAGAHRPFSMPWGRGGDLGPAERRGRCGLAGLKLAFRPSIFRRLLQTGSSFVGDEARASRPLDQSRPGRSGPADCSPGVYLASEGRSTLAKNPGLLMALKRAREGFVDGPAHCSKLSQVRRKARGGPAGELRNKPEGES